MRHNRNIDSRSVSGAESIFFLCYGILTLFGTLICFIGSAIAGYHRTNILYNRKKIKQKALEKYVEIVAKKENRDMNDKLRIMQKLSAEYTIECLKDSQSYIGFLVYGPLQPPQPLFDRSFKSRILGGRVEYIHKIKSQPGVISNTRLPGTSSNTRLPNTPSNEDIVKKIAATTPKDQ